MDDNEYDRRMLLLFGITTFVIIAVTGIVSYMSP